MELIIDVINHLEEAKDYIELVDKLVQPQTTYLDTLISDVKDIIKQPDYTIDIDVLQTYYLKLSTELYNMVDKSKQFEIYSSLAKVNETESYNNAYLVEMTSTEGKKPTVKELEIRAETKAKKEKLVNAVYASAFKTIKSKIDAGNMIADTLKNIIKVRINVDFTTNQVSMRGN